MIPCGPEPRICYDTVLEDWSRHPASPGEREIIGALSVVGVVGATILHVGVGQGDFEASLAPLAGQIDGITVNPAEVDAVNRLGLGNVRVLCADKASPKTYERLGRRYDHIVDVDLLAHCCCEYHLHAMLDLMRGALSPKGRLWTHAQCLNSRWEHAKGVAPETIPAMKRDDFGRLASAHGLALTWLGRIGKMVRL